MKEKIEISFQEWEQKLPWVIKYNYLMAKQDLTLKNCAELPEIRLNAIELHKAREGLQKPKPVVVDDTPKAKFSRAKIVDPVAEKFQNAVDNLIAKFCEPVEEEYSEFLNKINSKTPERDDYLTFTDELKTRCVQAATLRYLSKTDDNYNDSIVRFRANTQTKPEEVATKFDSEKEKCKKRYITDVLNKDKRDLQNRVSELQKEEAVALETFQKNKATITETEVEINKLVQPIKQEIATKKATLLPKNIPNNMGAPVLTGRPKAPPLSLLNKKPVVNKTNDTTELKQPTKPVAFNPLDLGSVVLKKRNAEVKPELEPVAVEQQINPENQQNLAAEFGAVLKNLQRTEATKALPLKKVEKTLEEMEESLDVVAVAIVTSTQKIEQLKQCIKQQKAFMDNQKKQLRELQNKDWKTEIQGETKKSETSDIPSEGQMKKGAGKAPPRRNIPIPPPMKKVETKKVEVKAEEKPVVSEEQKQDEAPKLTAAEEMKQALFDAMAKRRQAFEESEDWDDEEDIAEKSDKVAADNKRIAEENARKNALVKKYEVSVQQKNLVPETPIQDGNSRIIANEIQRLETKTAQPAVLAQLEEAVKELKVLEEAKAAIVETPKEETPKVETIVEAPKEVTQQVETPVETANETVQQVEMQEIMLEEPLVLLEEIITFEETPLDETPTDSPVENKPEVETPKVTDDSSALDAPKSQSGQTDVTTSLEESEESIKAQFKELCERSRFLKKIVADKEPNIGVMKDILAIKHFVDAKHEEAKTKNIDDSDKKLYHRSLDKFYINAANIRLSNAPLGKQKMQLENLATTVFTARHEGRRILADILLLISCLIGVGLAVGVGRVISGRSFFFIDAATQRESDFRKTIQEDESANRLIAPVA